MTDITALIENLKIAQQGGNAEEIENAETELVGAYAEAMDFTFSQARATLTRGGIL